MGAGRCRRRRLAGVAQRRPARSSMEAGAARGGVWRHHLPKHILSISSCTPKPHAPVCRRPLSAPQGTHGHGKNNAILCSKMRTCSSMREYRAADVPPMMVVGLAGNQRSAVPGQPRRNRQDPWHLSRECFVPFLNNPEVGFCHLYP